MWWEPTYASNDWLSYRGALYHGNFTDNATLSVPMASLKTWGAGAYTPSRRGFSRAPEVALTGVGPAAVVPTDVDERDAVRSTHRSNRRGLLPFPW